jgi:predicted aspartyl protease
MGNFSVALTVLDDSGARSEQLEAPVDTGASYTWVARPALEALGHTPDHDREFEMADGRKVVYGVKWITVRINGTEHPTPVVFGDPGTPALVGAVALQESGLAVDSLNERLVPVPGLLKGYRVLRRLFGIQHEHDRF